MVSVGRLSPAQRFEPEMKAGRTLTLFSACSTSCCPCTGANSQRRLLLLLLLLLLVVLLLLVLPLLLLLLAPLHRGVDSGRAELREAGEGDHRGRATWNGEVERINFGKSRAAVMSTNKGGRNRHLEAARRWTAYNED